MDYQQRAHDFTAVDDQQTHGRVVEHSGIVACATAPGRGAVAVLRISAPAALGLTQLSTQLAQQTVKDREATLCVLRDEQGNTLDQSLLIYFPAPHSYTGEDVLEIQCHGGPAVVDMLLAWVLRLAQSASIPLRLARPGEFSERAFLNGKMDLVQAEAVADLINANSHSAAQSANRSLQGVFSQLVLGLLEDLTHLRVQVEASLDFPEEEIDFAHFEQVQSALSLLCQKVKHTVEQAKQGVLLQEGVRVVIAGQPNAGKSSLLNALAQAELAIVTPIAGTTRDSIVREIHIQGVPLHFVDTAGLRQTQDEVERIGVKRSWAEIEKAEIVLFLHDASQLQEVAYAQEDAKIAMQLSQTLLAPSILHVYNKADLPVAQKNLQQNSAASQPLSVVLSCKEHFGLDSLCQSILSLCGWKNLPEGVFMARKRHTQALLQVQTHLQQGQAHFSSEHNMALDLLAEELRLAQNALAQITGAFGSDDLLGEIFAGFCIGK